MSKKLRLIYIALQKGESTSADVELQQKKTDSHSKEAQPNSTLQENAEAINVKEDDPDSAEAELPLEVRIERANQLIAA